MAILARRQWLRSLFLLALMTFSFCMHARAEEQPLQLYEQKIKAGLIYNFIKYTEWPSEKMSSPGAPIIVCVFGGDPFDGYLQPMEGRTVKQREITIQEVDTEADIAPCHLLFMGAEKKNVWPRLHVALANKSILTIGDFPSFSDNGGMIQFGKKNNHIYIELNMPAIRAAHLHIYDNIIKISKTMSPSPTGAQ